MSRDGSGNYTRVPGSAYTNGTTADGAELDAEINDIATALTQSIAKDGQTVPTANLPMGGYKHTNVNTASARTEYARASQVQDGMLSYLTSVSGADTITASAPIGLSAYAAGQQFCFVSAGANTGAVTLNINAIGAKAVTKNGTSALVADDIASGAVCVVVYDGMQFQLVSARAVSAATDTAAGIVELATNAEAQAGTDTARAVTPAGLASVTATETRAGLIELATSAEAQTGTDTARAITPATMKASQIVAGTAVDLSSGSPTTSTFSSIPAWVKRITVCLSGVSTNGTSPPMVQIGDAGGLETSGYNGCVNEPGVSTPDLSSGFQISNSTGSPASWHGQMVLTHMGSNIWACSGIFARSDSAALRTVAGTKQLSDVLTQVALTTVSGAGVFDAGTWNVLYE